MFEMAALQLAALLHVTFAASEMVLIPPFQTYGRLCEGMCEADITTDTTDMALSLLQRSVHSTQAVRQHARDRQHMPQAATTSGNTARGTAYSVKTLAYGEYFRGSENLLSSNTLTVFSPNVDAVFQTDAGMPLVMHFHGGGFIGGDATRECNSEVESYLNNGIAYVSVDYRLVGETFYYKDLEGSSKEEEFINVKEDGELSLDSSMLLSEYIVRTGWQELITKCVYDGARALDYLVEHAAELELDPHRISFTGDSAGTAIIFYLSLVYPRLKGTPSYTVVSVTLLNAQLNYPFLPMLDAAWKLWRDDLGEDALLSTICSKEGCPEVMGQGGRWCPRPDDCNATWSEEAATRFCGDSFAMTTLGDMVDWYTWPTDSAFNRGLTKLWYTSSNLANLERSEAEGPLFVYVANKANTLDLNGLTHAAFWARSYARVLEEKSTDDVMFVTRYEDYPGMGEAGKGTSIFGSKNYRSNFDWVAEGNVAMQPAVESEMLLFNCRAMGLSCEA